MAPLSSRLKGTDLASSEKRVWPFADTTSTSAYPLYVHSSSKRSLRSLSRPFTTGSSDSFPKALTRKGLRAALVTSASRSLSPFANLICLEFGDSLEIEVSLATNPVGLEAVEENPCDDESEGYENKENRPMSATVKQNSTLFHRSPPTSKLTSRLDSYPVSWDWAVLYRDEKVIPVFFP